MTSTSTPDPGPHGQSMTTTPTRIVPGANTFPDGRPRPPKQAEIAAAYQRLIEEHEAAGLAVAEDMRATVDICDRNWPDNQRLVTAILTRAARNIEAGKIP